MSGAMVVWSVKRKAPPVTKNHWSFLQENISIGNGTHD